MVRNPTFSKDFYAGHYLLLKIIAEDFDPLLDSLHYVVVGVEEASKVGNGGLKLVFDAAT